MIIEFITKTSVFAKYFVPAATVEKKNYFQCKDQSQGHNVIGLGVLKKVIISEVCMANIKLKSYSKVEIDKQTNK